MATNLFSCSSTQKGIKSGKRNSYQPSKPGQVQTQLRVLDIYNGSASATLPAITTRLVPVRDLWRQGQDNFKSESSWHTLNPLSHNEIQPPLIFRTALFWNTDAISEGDSLSPEFKIWARTHTKTKIIYIIRITSVFSYIQQFIN